jgi:pimeloyl-ACP methyl ester carboxylesterase
MPWISLPHQLNNRKFDKAIVFVHGLNGSARSWMGDSNKFVDRLSRIPAIYNNFGLFVFGYDTKIGEFGPAWKLFAAIPRGNEIAQKTKFNVDIKRISTELKTSLSNLLPGYKTIILVGHSIGGLVIKRALVEMGEAELKRIRFFISLSVPHSAAEPASISPDLFEKPELIAPKTLADFTSDLANRFSNITNPPESYYQTGNQDQVVKEGSAIPAGVQADHRIDTDDTHYSVLEIKDANSHLAFNKVSALLHQILAIERQQDLTKD